MGKKEMIPYYEKYVKLIKQPIKKAIKVGYGKVEIEEKLKEKRWPKDIVDEAFKQVTTEHKISKKRIILSMLYWLGLLSAVLSFFFQKYFIVLIGTGIVLMLLSIPLRISNRNQASQLKVEKLLEGRQALSKVPMLPKSVVKKLEMPVKKESFFSRLFKKKPRREKPKEIKQEAPKPKEKEQLEKRLIVQKSAMPKSPGLAVFLSIIPGFGHFYLGKVKKGLIILLTFWLIIPYLYGFIDAYKLAKEINKKVRPPQPGLVKKEEEKKKPKTRHKGRTFLLLLFSMLALGLVFYLYFNLPGFTRLNLTTYSVLIILVTLMMLPIVRKGRKKKDKKENEDSLPESKKVDMDVLRKEATRKGGENETDFDKLHKMVEKYGRIKIADVADTFNITKKEAEEWATILEQHSLATIYYPALGGPEIVRKKKKKVEEEENA